MTTSYAEAKIEVERLADRFGEDVVGRVAGGPLGAQHGADFVVPPGFPRDSFPMGVTSGERVIVIPRGGQMAGAAGNVSINVGPVTVVDPMDLAQLEATITNVVARHFG